MSQAQTQTHRLRGKSEVQGNGRIWRLEEDARHLERSEDL